MISIEHHNSTSGASVNVKFTPCALEIGNILIWFQNNCPATFVSLEWLSEKTQYSARHIRRAINEELAPAGIVSVKVRRKERKTNLFKVSELFFLPEIRVKFAHIFSNLRTLGMNVLFGYVRLTNTKFREYIKNLGYLGLGLFTKTMNLDSQSTKKIVNWESESKNTQNLKEEAIEMQNEMNAAAIMQHITPTIEEIGKRFNLTLAGKIFLTQFPEHILHLAYKTTKGKTGHFGYFVTVCKNSCAVQQVEPNWKLKCDLMKKAGLTKDAPHSQPRNTQTSVFSENNSVNPKGEMHESPQEDLGYTSATSRQAGPSSNPFQQDNTKPHEDSKRIFHEDGTYTGRNWREQDLRLKLVKNLPPSGRIEEYTAQQIADELRNWQKILDYELKQARVTIAEPSLAQFVDTNGKIIFIKSQLNRLVSEFNKRSQEEQSKVE